MTIGEFLIEIETIAEADPGAVSLDTNLASLQGWDSMAVISFIAMVDSKLGIALSAVALAECQTVLDLKRMVETKLSL